MTTSEDPLLVDAAEAARLLGVGRHAIYRGLPGLHPVRLGRRVRYRMSDVRAIVEGRRFGDGPAPREGDDPRPPNTDERVRLAQALGNALVRLLVDEGFMTVNEVNDRLVPMLNKRWTALFENWGDEHDEEDEG